jgi:hypothetical protein
MQALCLARRGRFREAQEEVAPGGNPPADLLSLQALAALATFAGDYRRALPLWRQIRVLEPENVEALRMVRAIELWQARPAWMKWLWPMLGGAVGLVLLVVLLMVFV